MKKLIYLIVLVLILGLVLTGCSLLSNISQVPATEQTKAKPAGNLAGAVKVPWNLSADVMPVPPYGSLDIPGSDTASKLIVNQPNGNTEVTITGAMNGLNPNLTYKVFLSKGWSPYVETGWNVEGAWVLRLILGNEYDHDIIINVQTDGTFSGTGGYPAGGSPYSYPYNEIITGTIEAMTGAVTIHSVYENGYIYDAIGTIAPDGTMSGTWGNDSQGLGHPWHSISGTAVKTHTGNDGWPGLFNPITVPAFTFTTDEFGAGSWHINLRDGDFYGAATYELSVWINYGRTILISDTFDVVVD